MLLGEHQAAVADPVQHGQVVGRQHDRLAGTAQLDDQLEQPLLGARIERGGGLVEQDQLGVRDQHGGDRDALLLAARQLVRRSVCEIGDLEHRHHVGDPLLDLVAADAELQRPEGHLFAHRR